MRSRKYKSGIINLSSVTTVIPMAGFAMYAGTKSFNDYFSKAIGEEYKGIIDVLSYKPGYVDTPMVSRINSKILVITPEECANAALNLLGRCESTHGNYKHYITAYILLYFKRLVNYNYLKTI